MNVELIYERTCPNIGLARTRLIEAFNSARLTTRWCEWEVNQPETPAHVRQYGSPTILVNGKDVSGGGNQATSNSCRLYATDAGYEPVPTVEQIAKTLGIAAISSKRRGFAVAAFPSVVVALLPKLTCPVCWPAYTALLSSAGIGFVNYTPYLLPTIATFLATTLWALAYRAKARRGYGPFWIGVAAALCIVAAKFILLSEPALYVGIGLLIGASVWNIWPYTLRRVST